MSGAVGAAGAFDTLPKLLARNAREYAAGTALREKRLGIWRAVTWAEYHARTRAVALGLVQLGLDRGDVVALIGDNRPDWVMGEVAAHAIGALSLGLYRDVLDEELAYLLGHSGAVAVLAEDEEQVDKLLALGERVPALRHIVYADPRGMRKYDDPRLLPLAELVALGEALHEEDPGLYERLLAAASGEDVAILCTTSGTTARPKLARLTAGALIRHCETYLRADPKGPDDEYVSVLPLPWIMEQIYAVGWNLIARMVVNFVEEPETTMADFREIGPTFVLFAPRVWESVAAEVRAKMMDATPLKRALFDRGMAAGLRALEHGRRSAFADQLLFRALRDRLGFSRLRSAATGGAALGPDTFRFFQAMGVPLRQLYGQTELLGAYTLHRPDAVDFDTVGVPFDDTVEMRILDPDANGVGEIVTRHPNMFAGYHGVDGIGDLRDGWLHTGDAGYRRADGQYVVIDRIRDIATTAQGDRFSPQYIENKLKFSSFVAEAVVLGDGRDHLAAILCIRYPIVSKWAERQRIPFTTYSDLAGKPPVLDLLRGEVERVNATLPPAQRIREFVLLYKELDADDDELTRTRKVRRGVIGRKYGDIIEAIYRGDRDIPVDAVIAFQDGTRQRVRTTLRVVTPGTGAVQAEAA
ncbi:AMP-binding protein [Roseomonas sp. NAR14]|uniref:AMP-binding protein n=1 Tax=Roseomonas acroporae TaxID=2937791 RepID=A0A9X1YCR4_9PROT|nr:AMP-binding protein [Roseomonas acroporae]MCK8786317.1 AMP-binding protein [Roseomonas acroporae]